MAQSQICEGLPMEKIEKKEERGKKFIQCFVCGSEKFLAETEGLHVLRFPTDTPANFEKVSGSPIDYIQCNECGEPLCLLDRIEEMLEH